jgi:hypothetical protein
MNRLHTRERIYDMIDLCSELLYLTDLLQDMITGFQRSGMVVIHHIFEFGICEIQLIYKNSYSEDQPQGAK